MAKAMQESPIRGEPKMGDPRIMFPMQTHTPASHHSGTRFSSHELLSMCQQFVYPPCKKLAGHIAADDRLRDLGFGGSTACLLALRTNETFQLEFPHQLTSIEVSTLDTVQDHITTIRTKLDQDGRLATD
jgi:hypothetical protein